MSKVTLKFHGGVNKAAHYSDGVNECYLSEPKSCIIVVDEADAVNKLRDHGDKFEVVDNEESILTTLEKAKEEEAEMNEAMGGHPHDHEDDNTPEEEEPELAPELEPEEEEGEIEVVDDPTPTPEEEEEPTIDTEPEPVVEDEEPSPDKTWTNSKIQKWLKSHDTKYETTDTKANLLELVEIVLSGD